MDTSFLLLFLGKDNQWLPIIMLLFLLFQKWNTIESFIHKLHLFRKTQYELKCKIYVNKRDAYTYGELTDTIWALFIDINSYFKRNSVKLYKAINIELPNNHSAFKDDEPVTIPSSGTYIQLLDTIKCTVDISSKDSTIHTDENNKNYDSIEECQITITLISTKTLDDIIKYLDHITLEYSKIKEKKRYEKKYIIKPQYSYKDERDSHVRMIPFTSTKTFHNLFFEGKEELLARLNTFINREKYASLGLPETLGLLFYGEPGCGKTSAIKAIANYLNMNLVIVPMHQIKTKKKLEDLFFGYKIDAPQDKRIYVFEEIDCNGWEDIVCDRKYRKNEVKSDNNTEQNAIEKIAQKLDSDSKRSKHEEDDKLTLGAILEVIDGLVECPGRIIIMTTNHKDFLDPALLRPGRIDMEIEFKKLRRSHILQIYEKWYGHRINMYVANDIPDYKYSQAEVSQMLFKHEKDSDGFITEITKHTL